MKIYAKTPTRIDLAGGTLDLWPIHHMLLKKATVNVAISLWAEVEVSLLHTKKFVLKSHDQNQEWRGDYDTVLKDAEQDLPLHAYMTAALWPFPERGLSITTKAGSPKGAGIGGSSSLAIALAAALYRMRFLMDGLPLPSEEHLVAFSQDIEARVIESPTGCQDYWAAVRGGINGITYPPAGPRVETYPVRTLPGLQDTVLLVYSGKARASALNNWDIYKGFLDKNPKIRAGFYELGSTAVHMHQALSEGHLGEVLELAKQEWSVRRSLWPAIESPETIAIHHTAQKAGAYFSRVCGAGGGGVVCVFCPPEKRNAIAQRLEAEGKGQILAASLTDTGLHIQVE